MTSELLSLSSGSNPVTIRNILSALKKDGVISVKFGTGGATIEDVRLFRSYIGQNVKIKVAGGIKTREDLILFLEEGCDRIGTSSAVDILVCV